MFVANPLATNAYVEKGAVKSADYLCINTGERVTLGLTQSKTSRQGLYEMNYLYNTKYLYGETLFNCWMNTGIRTNAH